MGILDYFLENSKKKKEKVSGKAQDAPVPREMMSRLMENLVFFSENNTDAGTEHDDKFFVQLGEVAPMDMHSSRIQSAQRISLLSYRKNPRAYRAIELSQHFVLGDGVRISAEDEDVQDLLEEHWKLNGWDERANERIRSLSIFGEQLYPAFVNEETGMVKIGSVSPLLIRNMLSARGNAEEIMKVFTSIGEETPGDGKGKKFSVIRLDDELELNPQGSNAAFYFAVNRINGQRRGLPDLLPSLDWLEGLDSFVFAMMERANLSANVVYDLEYKGLNDQELKDKVDQFNQNMREGGTFGHNENAGLTIQTPNMGSSEAEIMTRILVKHIQAGTGLAGLFYGDSDDLTRASASELSIPVAKMLQARQQYFKFMLKRIFDYQIQESIKAGKLSPTASLKYDVELPRVWLRDLKPVVDSLIGLNEVLGVGEERKYISGLEAKNLFRNALEQIGPLSAAGRESPDEPTEEEAQDDGQTEEEGGAADDGGEAEGGDSEGGSDAGSGD